jgi:hypothetical protein
VQQTYWYKFCEGLVPPRWVIERSTAWLSRFRRLPNDVERWPETVADPRVGAFVLNAAPVTHPCCSKPIPRSTLARVIGIPFKSSPMNSIDVRPGLPINHLRYRRGRDVKFSGQLAEANLSRCIPRAKVTDLVFG